MEGYNFLDRVLPLYMLTKIRDYALLMMDKD